MRNTNIETMSPRCFCCSLRKLVLFGIFCVVTWSSFMAYRQLYGHSPLGKLDLALLKDKVQDAWSSFNSGIRRDADDTPLTARPVNRPWKFAGLDPSFRRKEKNKHSDLRKKSKYDKILDKVGKIQEDTHSKLWNEKAILDKIFESQKAFSKKSREKIRKILEEEGLIKSKNSVMGNKESGLSDSALPVKNGDLHKGHLINNRWKEPDNGGTSTESKIISHKAKAETKQGLPEDKDSDSEFFAHDRVKLQNTQNKKKNALLKTKTENDKNVNADSDLESHARGRLKSKKQVKVADQSSEVSGNTDDKRKISLINNLRKPIFGKNNSGELFKRNKAKSDTEEMKNSLKSVKIKPNEEENVQSRAEKKSKNRKKQGSEEKYGQDRSHALLNKKVTLNDKVLEKGPKKNEWVNEEVDQISKLDSVIEQQISGGGNGDTREIGARGQKEIMEEEKYSEVQVLDNGKWIDENVNDNKTKSKDTFLVKEELNIGRSKDDIIRVHLLNQLNKKLGLNNKTNGKEDREILVNGVWVKENELQKKKKLVIGKGKEKVVNDPDYVDESWNVNKKQLAPKWKPYSSKPHQVVFKNGEWVIQDRPTGKVHKVQVNDDREILINGRWIKAKDLERYARGEKVPSRDYNPEKDHALDNPAGVLNLKKNPIGVNKVDGHWFSAKQFGGMGNESGPIGNSANANNLKKNRDGVNKVQDNWFNPKPNFGRDGNPQLVKQVILKKNPADNNKTGNFLNAKQDSGKESDKRRKPSDAIDQKDKPANVKKNHGLVSEPRVFSRQKNGNHDEEDDKEDGDDGKNNVIGEDIAGVGDSDGHVLMGKSKLKDAYHQNKHVDSGFPDKAGVSNQQNNGNLKNVNGKGDDGDDDDDGNDGDHEDDDTDNRKVKYDKKKPVKSNRRLLESVDEEDPASSKPKSNKEDGMAMDLKHVDAYPGEEDILKSRLHHDASKSKASLETSYQNVAFNEDIKATTKKEKIGTKNINLSSNAIDTSNSMDSGQNSADDSSIKDIQSEIVSNPALMQEFMKLFKLLHGSVGKNGKKAQEPKEDESFAVKASSSPAEETDRTITENTDSGEVHLESSTKYEIISETTKPDKDSSLQSKTITSNDKSRKGSPSGKLPDEQPELSSGDETREFRVQGHSAESGNYKDTPGRVEHDLRNKRQRSKVKIHNDFPAEFLDTSDTENGLRSGLLERKGHKSSEKENRASGKHSSKSKTAVIETNSLKDTPGDAGHDLRNKAHRLKVKGHNDFPPEFLDNADDENDMKTGVLDIANSYKNNGRDNRRSGKHSSNDNGSPSQPKHDLTTKGHESKVKGHNDSPAEFFEDYEGSPSSYVRDNENPSKTGREVSMKNADSDLDIRAEANKSPRMPEGRGVSGRGDFPEEFFEDEDEFIKEEKTKKSKIVSKKSKVNSKSLLNSNEMKISQHVTPARTQETKVRGNKNTFDAANAMKRYKNGQGSPHRERSKSDRTRGNMKLLKNRLKLNEFRQNNVASRVSNSESHKSKSENNASKNKRPVRLLLGRKSG